MDFTEKTIKISSSPGSHELVIVRYGYAENHGDNMS